MEKSATACEYGFTPIHPKKPQNPFKAELTNLLQTPHLPEVLTSFEREHQLPKLSTTSATTHAREIRYLLMTHQAGHIFKTTAQEITASRAWYALAGMS